MLEADATQDVGVSKKQPLSKREIEYEALLKKRAEASGREHFPTQEVEVRPEEITSGQDDIWEDQKDKNKEPTNPDEGEIKEEEKPIPKQDGVILTFFNDQGQEIKVPATAKIRLKVDGQEVDESLDRVTRSYQKGSAADKRLEQATKLQRELEIGGLLFLKKKRGHSKFSRGLNRRKSRGSYLKTLTGMRPRKWWMPCLKKRTR